MMTNLKLKTISKFMLSSSDCPPLFVESNENKHDLCVFQNI